MAKFAIQHEAFAVVLRANEKEMMDGFFCVCADGAVGCDASFDTMEVLVERDMTCAEIHVETDKAFREVSD